MSDRARLARQVPTTEHQAITVRGERPPRGTITLAMAATLSGLSERSLSSLRMHLAPVRIGRRWCGPGDRRPRELYDEREVRRIAEALGVRGGENPYRPNMRLHKPPRAPRPRSNVSADVRAGWSTTADIRAALGWDPVDVSLRTIRRHLDRSCAGPLRPDAVDIRIIDAFGLLLDEAGRPRVPLRVPSEVRLVERRLQRVYPHAEALDWIEAGGLDSEGFAHAGASLSFRAELALHGIKWRPELGGRNSWIAFVKGLVSGGEQRIAFAAHRVAAFIADRKKQWLAEKADAVAIAHDLRDALPRASR